MDCVAFQSLIGICINCNSVRGHQSTSSLTEFSIPDRDCIFNTLVFQLYRFMGHKIKWSSDSGLIKPMLKLCTMAKPSSTETEIRCSLCLHLFNVTDTSIRPTLISFFEDKKAAIH